MQNILNHKKYILFILSIFITFLIWGFIYYYSLKDNIVINISNMNLYNLLINIIIYSIILTFSFLLIGFPISIIYLGYESFILVFLFNTMFKKGIIMLLYIPIKIISLFLLIIFIYRLLNISKYTLRYIIYREEYIKNKMIFNYKNNIYIIGINILLDILIVLFVRF